MAFYFDEPSRTFNEYLLVPGHTPADCTPAAVSLRTPLVKYRKGQEECPISLNVPMVSAIMAAVSDDRMAVALATQGGLSFIYGNQTIESEAAMVARVKDYKAGFVTSDANLSPDMTLGDVVELKEQYGHSTMPVTADGTAHGKLVGIVTERDYRLSRMSLDEKVADFMTPREKLIVAPADVTLKAANDIIWEHKLNSLPVVDGNDCLVSLVFRKDYDSHKENPDEMLDTHKRYRVGAGINSRDYAERVPALVEAGADVLCIDSSEGYSDWQKMTIQWVRDHYGDDVKIGAGNVVDREGFRFLADTGADFVKIGIDFARFDESPSAKVMVNGTYMKEYWGEGSARARNWGRYDLGGKKKSLSFEEGVDSYVPYAGSLKDNMDVTLLKLKSTMCNCGALTIPDFQDKAKLTLVSATSIVEGGAHDVLLKDKAPFASNTR